LETSDILGEHTNTTMKDTEALLEANKEVGLQANTGKTKYMSMSHHSAG